MSIASAITKLACETSDPIRIVSPQYSASDNKVRESPEHLVAVYNRQSADQPAAPKHTIETSKFVTRDSTDGTAAATRTAPTTVLGTNYRTGIGGKARTCGKSRIA